MELTRIKPQEGVGTMLIAFFAVVLLDVFVAFIALMFLMGDHAPTVPPYDYSEESWINVSILLTYSSIVLGTGLYWQYTRQCVARLIGMALGISPIIALAFRFLSHLLFGH